MKVPLAPKFTSNIRNDCNGMVLIVKIFLGRTVIRYSRAFISAVLCGVAKSILVHILQNNAAIPVQVTRKASVNKVYFLVILHFVSAVFVWHYFRGFP